MAKGEALELPKEFQGLDFESSGARLCGQHSFRVMASRDRCGVIWKNARIQAGLGLTLPQVDLEPIEADLKGAALSIGALLGFQKWL